MINLNLLYNKIYYDGLGREVAVPIENLNKCFTDAQFIHERDYRKPFWKNDGQYHSFLLRTVYPGLLIGTGYPHDARMGEDEFSLGFSFDYVSGQPYIPGSSVKGALRSHMKQYPEVVCGVAEVEDEDLQALDKSIFEGEDLFLDAVLFDSGNKQGHILGEDYITPHNSPTTNPKPVKMSKILPGVKFEFRFRLTDTKLSEEKTVTAVQKAALFQELLELFGIGAKTNVGYGILEKTNGSVASVTPSGAPLPVAVRVNEAQQNASEARQNASVARRNTPSGALSGQNASPRTNVAPTSGNRPVSPIPSSNLVTTKVCPHCHATNEKYVRDAQGQPTRKVDQNWIHRVCQKCGGKME